jgi:hypothetical protein
VSAAERIAVALADRLGGLDAAAMAAHRAFREAVDGALAVLGETAIVEAVLAMGSLAGARNPHSVVVSRIRALPAHARLRAEVEVEREAIHALDTPRARAVRAAADRGAVLRVQVGRGAMTRQEALHALQWECKEAEQLGVALAAFDGGSPSSPADAHRTDVAPAGVVR